MNIGIVSHEFPAGPPVCYATDDLAATFICKSHAILYKLFEVVVALGFLELKVGAFWLVKPALELFSGQWA